MNSQLSPNADISGQPANGPSKLNITNYYQIGNNNQMQVQNETRSPTGSSLRSDGSVGDFNDDISTIAHTVEYNVVDTSSMSDLSTQLSEQEEHLGGNAHTVDDNEMPVQLTAGVDWRNNETYQDNQTSDTVPKQVSADESHPHLDDQTRLKGVENTNEVCTAHPPSSGMSLPTLTPDTREQSDNNASPQATAPIVSESANQCDIIHPLYETQSSEESETTFTIFNTMSSTDTSSNVDCQGVALTEAQDIEVSSSITQVIQGEDRENINVPLKTVDGSSYQEDVPENVKSGQNINPDLKAETESNNSGRYVTLGMAVFGTVLVGSLLFAYIRRKQ